MFSAIAEAAADIAIIGFFLIFMALMVAISFKSKE
jgi:hypothetical protein